tara:strand:- start:7485 stop:7973 length:489 start_codon:yes stop_codon:yes gene_type:complete
MAVKGLRNLCTPSYIYLVVSVIALVVMMYQNMGNVDKYCLGSYSCNVSSTAMIFIIKAVYILFWTWVLNLICKAGATGVAWFVLLLPLILLFVLLAGMMFYENSKEGMSTNQNNSSSGSYSCSNANNQSQCINNKNCGWNSQFKVCEPTTTSLKNDAGISIG